MKKIFLGIALVLVTGCGAADGTPGEKTEATESENSPLIIRRRCDEATCSAAGGSCVGTSIFASCEPGCENSPGSCTATVPDPLNSQGYNDPNGYGWLLVECTGLGNGVYTVSETTAPAIQTGFGSSPPNGPWFGYSPYSGGTYQYTFGGGQIQFAVDEDDIYLPGCDNGQNQADCQIHASYVQVCATPGAGQYTEQSGICGNLESFPQACVTVPVTYQ